MRSTFSTLGAAAILGGVLTACGGGSSTPAQSTVPLPSSSIPPVVQGITPTGPTAPMTISVAIPQRTTTSAAHALVSKRIHALYGAKSSDSRIRTMANTSPSATIRSAGVQLEQSAKQIEQKTGRSPEYVSPGTYYMEFVMASGATPVFDQTTTCSISSNQCSATFNVPVGSGFTAALYLYDDCDYLLSAGATSNVTVVTGSNPPLTLNLNPVVAYFDITSTASAPFVADTSEAQPSFNVSVTPLDAEYYNTQTNNTVATPGVLMDSTFHQITSVTLALQSPYSDVTPSAPQTLNVPVLAQNSINAYTFPTTAYAFAGTGTESSVVWTATPNTNGSPLVPNVETGPYGSGTPSPGTDIGQLTIADNPIQLSWTNVSGYPTGALGDPIFASQGTSANTTYWSAEFPLPNNTSTYTFGLSENIPFSGNIYLADNGNCVSSVVSSYAPALGGPYAFSVLDASPYVQITMNSSSNTSACIVTATDDAATPRSSQLQLFVDSSTLTIQNKARAHQ
jgi:hypothetical protein